MQATKDQAIRALEVDARREAREMSDADLGTYLTFLRRALVMAESDGLAEWLVAWDTVRLGAAEQEWDWRRAAERKGGPAVAREGFRERLEAVRARHDVLGVASRYTVLKRSGREYKGLCPFHQEKSPSFCVNLEKQVFLCRGCGIGGDVFRLVELKETGDFVAALHWLEAQQPVTAALAEAWRAV